MNPQDPLAQLHPLREPAVIGWWPLAPGWWILFGALLLLLAIVLYRYYRRYQSRRYRRLAQGQLGSLYERWQAGGDASQFYADTNALLKATALCAYKRSDVAPLSGDHWTRFLVDSVPKIDEPPAELGENLYRQQPQGEPRQLFEFASHWIQNHREAR